MQAEEGSSDGKRRPSRNKTKKTPKKASLRSLLEGRKSRSMLAALALFPKDF